MSIQMVLLPLFLHVIMTFLLPILLGGLVARHAGNRQATSMGAT